ncbi:MAG: HesA/MoeB/ThiF family protein [Thermodesulfovibrionales bacterium]|nr:HesA/MoeB/ThiF family protein [Thermodesulfovibrionales bacterium]
MAKIRMDAHNILDYLRENAIDGVLSHKIIEYAVNVTKLSFQEVERISLANGLIPKRYVRNQRLIKPAEQLTLLNSCVSVVGCGGLGGYTIEMLARLGVGHLICIDPDYFREEDLNRQRFCNLKTLGQPKAEVIKEELKSINPAVVVKAHTTSFLPEIGETLLEGAQVVIDALDSFEARTDLAETCKRLSIPFVHGAIAGWYGQVSVQDLESSKLIALFRSSCGKRELQKELGNPSFAPPFISAIQVAETIKILLNRSTAILSDRLFFCDLLTISFEIGHL